MLTALGRQMQNLPGGKSLRGRYLYAAGAFALALLASAMAGKIIVTRTTTAQIDHAADRAAVADIVRDLMLHVGDIETAVQRFIIRPEDRHQQAMWENLVLLENDLSRAAATRWIDHDPNLQTLLYRLQAAATRLRGEIDVLIDIRSHSEKWFPVMQVMLDRLLPDNTRFATAAQLGLSEARDELDSGGSLEVYHHFVAARYAWAQMTSEFRLFVANRFGLFADDPESGMAARRGNIQLFAETVESSLNRLLALDQQGQVGFEGSEAVAEMAQLRGRWLAAYEDVVELTTTGEWRSDLPILRDRIDPLFSEIRGTLRQFELALEDASESDATQLGDTATQLSNTLWILGILGTALTLGGFLLFQRMVLSPIEVITRALHAEAKGQTHEAIPEATLIETQGLTEAFSHMREQVHMRQQRLANILDNAAEGIITIDEQGLIESFNNAAEHLFGYTSVEIIGTNISRLIAASDAAGHDGFLAKYLQTGERHMLGEEREVDARHKDGTVIPISIRVSETIIQGRRLFTGLVADISERKAMVESLRKMAEHDALTGLYNRAYFQTELERVVNRMSHQHSGDCALMYIDLDNFKYINDTMGHAAGDKLLVEVSGILRRRARRSDLIARFGGDEFVVLLYETNEDEATNVAESFRKQLVDYTFAEGKERVDVGCSIGVTMIADGTASADDVLAQADLACHVAKRKGRNQVYCFNSEDTARLDSMSLDMGWSRRIKDAIEQNRFTMVCQPIVATGSGDIEAFEVLIRMLDDNDEHIMPSGFLPSAERFGLAVDIDKWVIVNAIEGLAEQQEAMPELCYSLNLSAQTLTDLSTVDLIAKNLRRNNVDPASLIFEITETVAIADMDVAKGFLKALKALGCRTALDDFGAGFTSFAYLKELAVDILKIDGHYIKHLKQNETDQAMVKAMTDVAHVMGLRTVAEWVEDQETMELLREYGVDMGQGYYLGRPSALMPCKLIAQKGGLPATCEIPAEGTG